MSEPGQECPSTEDNEKAIESVDDMSIEAFQNHIDELKKAVKNGDVNHFKKGIRMMW
jgi:hypothetical protein